MKSDYRLSIRFASDGFSLLIQDQSGSAIAQMTVTEALFQRTKDEIIHLVETKTGIVPADYGELQVVVETDAHVFVPSTIFKIQDIDDYFYFQHEKDKDQLVLFNRVENWDAVNIFSIPAQLNDALNELFPDAVVKQHLTEMLSAKVSRQEDAVYVYIRPKMMDLIVIKSKTLLLINSFAINTPEDMAFYVLSIYDQLKLDTETIGVKIYGRINSLSNYKLQIANYLKNVDLVIC